MITLNDIKEAKKNLRDIAQNTPLSKAPILSKELNDKFGFTTKVIKHKDKYHVLLFNSKDAKLLHDLIKEHVHFSMRYKLPSI